jgi:hypothetical protein
MKPIYLHIGTHKTGSTSLQRWLVEHESFLNENEFDLYESLHKKQTHVELYLGAMRQERDSFGKRSMPEVVFDTNYTAKVSARVQEFIASSPREKLVFSTEGLSLLRHADELNRLKQILGPLGQRVQVILYLRDKEAFLNSYRTQLAKKKKRTPSKDYWSALYVEEDTWLTDYEQLLGAFGEAFGRENITIIDYDAEMQRCGNIIPAFVKALGLPVEEADQASMQAYRDNVTRGMPQKPPKPAGTLKRLFNKLRPGS